MTYYNILVKGRKIYSELSEEEYFDILEDLSNQFYETGSPHPTDIDTEFIEFCRKIRRSGGNTQRPGYRTDFDFIRPFQECNKDNHG